MLALIIGGTGMARTARAATLGMVALVLCSCGTFGNLSIGRRQGWKNALIYGGVRRDVQSAADFVDHSWTWGEKLDVFQDVGTVVGVGLVGIDVPLSAVADTLTLPITIPAAIWGRASGATTVSSKNIGPPAPPSEPVNSK